MKRLITLASMILASSSLSGCMATTAIASAAVGGSVATDKRTICTQIYDHELHQAVLNNIHRIPNIKSNGHITATVFDDVLLLSGQTTNPFYRKEVIRAAQNAGHFKRLYNRIDIAKPASLTEIGEDAWLTTKIKAAMISEKGLHSSQVKLITENKTVYLMGIVTKKQGDLAADVSRQIPSVNKVVKLFEYTG